MFITPDRTRTLGTLSTAQLAKTASYSPIFKKMDYYRETGEVQHPQPTKLQWIFKGKTSYKTSEFTKIDDTKIYFKKGSKTTSAPISNFSTGSELFARALQNQLLDKALKKTLGALTDSFIYPKEEEWVSAESGKSVKAVFKGLTDSTLTLSVKRFGQADRMVEMPLEKFDEASQAKANKWQSTLTDQIAKEKKAREDALNNL